MEIKVYGGSHLGIKGCFGEKLFTVSTFEDLIKKIRKERKFKSIVKLTCYIHTSNGLTFQFCKEKSDKVIFEFRIISVTY